MRAAVIDELGGEPALRDVPVPEPAGEDHLVAISTAALNPADLVYAAGIRLQPPLPYVPGLEGVGRLEDGSRVYVSMAPPPHGTFAEYAVAPAGTTMAVPDDVTDEQALCVGVAGTTAWLALTWKGALRAGESVLVTGATGSVGQIAVQAAAALGASRVVAAGRDHATLRTLREQGATDTVVLEGDYAAALADASRGGFDLVVDALFGEPLMAAIRATRMGGRVVNLGMRAGRSMQLDGIALKGKDLLSCNIGDAGPADIADAFGHLIGLVQAGRIAAESETVPLAEVTEIWRRQDSSPHRKLLLAV
ncbi:zinc-binding dehydrogenase [Nocardioides sp. LHD-245]|uniref:quinone oxidoreductase family protein n=1 Tax=Nocardioides sp. LHD-245 TaxID=3051387 RepID=UPI0027DF3DD0|nr:zinc-binding dehydrogenase [Nocardioides sp. LHD-245]